MPNPDPLYHQEPEEWEDEYTYEPYRLIRSILIAIPIGLAMWAVVIYAVCWILKRVFLVWTVAQ